MKYRQFWNILNLQTIRNTCRLLDSVIINQNGRDEVDAIKNKEIFEMKKKLRSWEIELDEIIKTYRT